MGTHTYFTLGDAFADPPHMDKTDLFVDVNETGLSTPESLETPEESDDETRYLVASPYTEKEHLLDLETLNVENQLLAQALVHMRNVRDDYTTAPYQDSFNWSEIVDILRDLTHRRSHVWKETSFYLVAFRSQIPPTTVYAELGELDKAAHAEATASGGFLKYWFGWVPDAAGRNLATCVWSSKKHAQLGNVGPAHRKAAGAAKGLYSTWALERYRFVVRDSIESWAIEDWKN